GIFTDPLPEHPPERDIDVLFVGNLSPAVQAERLRWLGRLSRLSQCWKVVIAQVPYGPAYRDLLLRCRGVFNRSLKGEWNLRTGEACSCGALLFMESTNREMAGVWEHGRDCVFYDEEDLQSLLEHYLSHEEERRAIAHTGQHQAREHSFAF